MDNLDSAIRELEPLWTKKRNEFKHEIKMKQKLIESMKQQFGSQPKAKKNKASIESNWKDNMIDKQQ